MSNDKGFIEIVPIEGNPSVQKMLDEAKTDQLDYVLLIGKKDDGWYFSSSEPDPMKALFCADQFRNFIMSSQ